MENIDIVGEEDELGLEAEETKEFPDGV